MKSRAEEAADRIVELFNSSNYIMDLMTDAKNDALADVIDDMCLSDTEVDELKDINIVIKVSAKREKK